jgi:hypothetical protein
MSREVTRHSRTSTAARLDGPTGEEYPFLL